MSTVIGDSRVISALVYLIYIERSFLLFLEMVKEIRDAAEMREKVLLSKVEKLVDSCLNSKKMVGITMRVLRADIIHWF